MREYTYALGRQNYTEWLYWEAESRIPPGVRKNMFFSTLVATLFALLAEMMVFRGKMQIVRVSALVGAVVLILVLLMMSRRIQVIMLRKLHGLDRMMKSNCYPKVTLTLGKQKFSFFSDQDHQTQSFFYNDIEEFIELKETIVLTMNDHSVQFISKSAFPNKGESESFTEFIRRKRVGAATESLT